MARAKNKHHPHLITRIMVIVCVIIKSVENYGFAVSVWNLSVMCARRSYYDV